MLQQPLLIKSNCSFVVWGADIAVKEVKDKGMDFIKFRRTLYGETEECWHEICELMENTVLSDEPDTLRWTISSSGQFSVRSLYLQLKAGS